MSEAAPSATADWGEREWLVYAKVRDFVADAADVPLEAVTPEVNIFEDLKVDSLGLVLIMINLEDTFGVQEPENVEDIGPQLQTPAAIVAFALEVAGDGFVVPTP